MFSLGIMKKISRGQKNTYQFVQKIGEGSHGEVFMYKSAYTNQKVAIKVQIKTCRLDSQEIPVLKIMNHPNIVKYIDSLVIGEYECIIMEYVPYTLIKYLNKNEFNFMNLKIILKQILDAMKYLEYIQVIHIDIKPNNILLDENLNVKLIDFGICCTIQDKSLNFSMDSDLDTALKEFPQIAPEILSDDFFDNSADIYSFGYVCSFIQERFIKNFDFAEKNVRNSNVLFSNLIDISFKKSPVERSSIRALIFHPFFDELYEFLECFCNFDNIKLSAEAMKIEINDGKIYIKKENIEYTLYCLCHVKSKTLYSIFKSKNAEALDVSTNPDYKTDDSNTNKFAVKKESNILPIQFLNKEELLMIKSVFELIKKNAKKLQINSNPLDENRIDSYEDQIKKREHEIESSKDKLLAHENQTAQDLNRNESNNIYFWRLRHDLSNDFKGFKQESTIYLIVSGEPVSDTDTKATIKKDEIKKVIKKMYEDLVKTGKEKNNVIMHQAFEDPSVIKNKGDATLILDLINSLKFTRIKKGGIISICANGVPQMIKDKKQGQDYDKLKNIIEEKIKKKK
ncbi:protein kinase [Hamiltosporidium tvaerminnensis]|uniref:Protein kinase n=1 Tax=Hamiltosporidium tvaerminnensis TaxID=1176355 RepID=A0A4Q9L041_9MICR|nr:protein kinase [Hamiltosporidium tvaerminnensis]